MNTVLVFLGYLVLKQIKIIPFLQLWSANNVTDKSWAQIRFDVNNKTQQKSRHPKLHHVVRWFISLTWHCRVQQLKDTRPEMQEIVSGGGFFFSFFHRLLLLWSNYLWLTTAYYPLSQHWKSPPSCRSILLLKIISIPGLIHMRFEPARCISVWLLRGPIILQQQEQGSSW